MKLEPKLWWVAVIASAVITFGATCVPKSAAGPLDPNLDGAPVSETVVLIAIDGVRWQDIFYGVDPRLAKKYGLREGERSPAQLLVPNITRLARTTGASVGAAGSGSLIAASGPNFVSLPGYMEMLTGRRDPGCTENDCGIVDYSTVADDASRLPAGSSVVASWPGIARAASASPGTVHVSAGRRTGSDRAHFSDRPLVARALRAGERARPEPGWGDFRPDHHTAELALATLDGDCPAFLFVGLGETDEFAHQGDYRAYLDALRRADALVGCMATRVERLNANGHPTTLLVTTDHGRANDFETHGREHPESARVWLVATGAGITARGAVRSPRKRSLADLGATVRSLLGLRGVVSHDAGQPLTEIVGLPVAGAAGAFARYTLILAPRTLASLPARGPAR